MMNILNYLMNTLNPVLSLIHIYYKENIFENKVFHSEINLKPHVLAIAIVRLVIADFLERRDNENWYEYVHDCIENEKIKNL